MRYITLAIAVLAAASGAEDGKRDAAPAITGFSTGTYRLDPSADPAVRRAEFGEFVLKSDGKLIARRKRPDGGTSAVAGIWFWSPKRLDLALTGDKDAIVLTCRADKNGQGFSRTIGGHRAVFRPATLAKSIAGVRPGTYFLDQGNAPKGIGAVGTIWLLENGSFRHRGHEVRGRTAPIVWDVRGTWRVSGDMLQLWGEHKNGKSLSHGEWLVEAWLSDDKSSFRYGNEGLALYRLRGAARTHLK